MTIATFDGYLSAKRHPLRFYKPVWNTTSNANGPWGDPIHQPGDPDAVAAVANTSSGVVPTNATSGYPQFTLSGGGYLAGVSGQCISSSAGTQQLESTRFLIYDRLFEAGPFVGAHAAYTLTSQPSFASRVPGANYAGLLLLVTVGGTGSSGPTGALSIGYLDENGAAKTASITTGVIQCTTFSATYVVPLQAGGKGVQKIQYVDTSSLSNGNVSYNVVVARPLVMGFMESGGVQYQTASLCMEDVGFAPIYDTSAVCLLQSMNRGTSFCGAMDLVIEIAGS